MRIFSAYLVVAMVLPANGSEPDNSRAKQEFKSEHYRVTWGIAPAYGPEAELEIGDGNGHGGSLRWFRFRPVKKGVDVLSVQLAEGRNPYESRWPPDRTAAVVKRALLKSDAYAELLRELAVVESASLKPVAENSFTTSTYDFWVYAQLTANKKTLLELNWAGYEGSVGELDYARPRAAVSLARKTIERLDFKEHTLTAAEREWASTKFARDRKKFKGVDAYWWVRERYIETVGVVGDQTALPVLREILAANPPKGKPRDASDSRCVYFAINAVTRLTKKDVREKPVEEMDIEKTRLKVLDLIKEKK